MRAATCLDFVIIEFKQQFCGNTHTHTRKHTHTQSTVPSTHVGKGNEKEEKKKYGTKNRPAQGAYNNLLKELEQMDTSSYCNFVRMDSSTLEELLVEVAPLIKKQDTIMRDSISPGERLTITLQFLAIQR